MRVERLTLKEFRSHKDSELVFDWVNFVLGPNAAGKSSIQMALEFALCGRCTVTDAAGRGREQLVRLGAGDSGFAVEVTMSGKRYGRAVNKRGSSVSQDGHLIAGEFDFGISKEALSAVLNAGAFLRLPTKEQKALLASVLDAGGVDLPADIAALMETVFKSPAPHTVQNVAEADRQHQAFYEERTVIGRQLRDLPEPGDYAPPADLPAEATVKQQLAELRKDKEKLVAQKAQFEAPGTNNALLRKQLEAEKERLEGQLLDDATEKRMIAARDSRDRVAGWRKELEEVTTQVAALEAQAKKLNELGDACPTCDRPLIPLEREASVSRLLEQAAPLRSRRTLLDKNLSEVEDPQRAEVAMAAHRSAVVEITRIERQLKDLPKEKKAPPDTSGLATEIEAIAVRITNGESVLARVQEEHRKAERITEIRARRALLTKKHDACDRLVEYFGPNGVKTQMVEGRITEFLKKLNAALEHFGYVVNLILEPYRLELDCDDPLLPPRTVQQLSESEAFRFGVALQIALAMATGVNLVVVDRADVLDKTNRPFLAGLLCHAARELGVQSIVLSTSSEAPPADPPEGVRFFQVVNDHGISQVLTAGVEVAA